MTEINQVIIRGALADAPQEIENQNHNKIIRFKLLTSIWIMRGNATVKKTLTHVCVMDGELAERWKGKLHVGEFYQIQGQLDYQYFSGNHTTLIRVDAILSV